MSYYILRDHIPVAIKIENQKDMSQWCQFMCDLSKKIVKQEKIGDVELSTVFLGIDHNFMRDEEPILFETMIFGGCRDQDQFRYCTWDEALAGHEKIKKELIELGETG